MKNKKATTTKKTTTAKPKATAKKTTTRKKTTPEQKAQNKVKVQNATGKTIEDCEKILAEYKANRKAQKEQNKDRLDNLEKKGHLIEGTDEKTLEATTKTVNKEVKPKIEKEVKAIVDTAEKEAKKEVSEKGKTKEQVEKEVKQKAEKIITKKVDDMTKDLAKVSANYIKNIRDEIASLGDKKKAQEFLLELRKEIDLLLKAYGYGGAVQSYNVPWMGGQPMPSYAKGGKVEFETKLIKGYADELKDYTHFAIHKPTNSIAGNWDYKEYDKEELMENKDDYFFMDLKDDHEGNVDKFKKSDFAIITRSGLKNKGIDLNNYDVFNGQKYAKGGNFADGGRTARKIENEMINLQEKYMNKYDSKAEKQSKEAKSLNRRIQKLENEFRNSFAKGGSVDEVRIYVADLEAYNNGQLKGGWLDLTDYSDGSEVMEAIDELIDGEEYAIHDYEGFPSNMYSEYMGEEDFNQIIEIYNAQDEIGIPMDVILEFMSDRGLDDISTVQDAYLGEYDSFLDYAIEMVDEGIYVPSSFDVYMTDTDRRIVAGEEADYFVDNLSEEEAIDDYGDRDAYDEAEEEEDFDKTEELVDEAKEEAREQVYDSTYEALSDPVDYFVNELGSYTEEDLLKQGFITVDYEKVARELEYDNSSIRSNDGQVYVFSNNYAKGGKLRKKTKLGWKRDRQMISQEPWEQAYKSKRKGKYRSFARGGITKNNQIIEQFLDEKVDNKLRNISIQYSTLGDAMLLRNYGTLIAKRVGKKVFVSKKKYSSTTSTIQNAIVRMAKERGMKVTMIDEDEF